MSIRELEQVYRRTYRRLITGILIAHGASLLLVLALAVGHPRVTTWMSKAVQAQLAGTAARSAPDPARLGQPGKEAGTIRVY
jgi:hypothetical protein